MHREKNGKEMGHNFEIIVLLNRISKPCTSEINFQEVSKNKSNRKYSPYVQKEYIQDDNSVLEEKECDRKS